MEIRKQKTLANYFEELAADEMLQVPIDPAGKLGWSESTIYTTAQRKGCVCKKDGIYIQVTKKQ